MTNKFTQTNMLINWVWDNKRSQYFFSDGFIAKSDCTFLHLFCKNFGQGVQDATCARSEM